MSAAAAVRRFEPAKVQGNILRGYRYKRVRYLMLEVTDVATTRRWLGATVTPGSGAPAITTEVQWTVKPDTCFNLAVTYPGLRALGVPKASLASFPTEFVQGMNSRAVKVGDTGPSAPEHWATPFNEPGKLHLIASIYANDIAHLDRVEQQVTATSANAFSTLGVRDGWCFDGDTVHFGYRDNISEPRFEGIHDPDQTPDAQPMSPLGAMLMGYPTEYEGLMWNVPEPDALGSNGSFNAFRVLAQDVAGFEAYLSDAARNLLADPLGPELLPPGEEARIGPGLSRHAALREIVAAKMCGRWRNGVPLALSPETPDPDAPVSLTDFDYSGGASCPFGAHIRRCNPRGGTIVQRAARHTRRLVRRGTPYGPAFDPANPDSEERGLLGNFLCANLGAQFEALACDWMNLGLQDPRITGSNDPLLGANTVDTSWLDIPLPSGSVIRLRGLPRFVRTRGGAYTFLPGLPAIRYLAALGDGRAS